MQYIYQFRFRDSSGIHTLLMGKHEYARAMDKIAHGESVLSVFLNITGRKATDVLDVALVSTLVDDINSSISWEY